MTVPAFGFESALGIGFETFAAYGTGVAASEYARLIRMGIAKDRAPAALPSASGYPVELVRGATAGLPRHFNPPPRVGGPVLVEFDYAWTPVLLYNILSTENAAGNAPAGYAFTSGTGRSGANANVGKHAFDLPSAIANMQRSLTLYWFNGQELVRFVGCVVESFTIEIPNDGPATLEVTVVAEDSERDTAGNDFGGAGFGTASFIQTAPIRIFEILPKLGAVGGALSDITDIQSVRITVSRPLRRIPTTRLTAGTSVPKIIRPLPEGPFEIMIGLTADWDSDTYQDIYEAATLGGQWQALSVQALSEFEIPGAGTPETFSQLWEFPACLMMGDPPKYDGGSGPIVQTLNFKAGIDSSLDILKATFFSQDNVAILTA